MDTTHNGTGTGRRDFDDCPYCRNGTSRRRGGTDPRRTDLVDVDGRATDYQRLLERGLL